METHLAGRFKSRDETEAGPIRVTAAGESLANDVEVGARLADGDGAAFQAAINRYWAPLTRYAARMLGDLDAAHDIAQDAFLRLWESREGLRSTAVGAYLFRVAHNLMVDEVRKRAVRERCLASADDSLVPTFPLDPAELVERKELHVTIEEAVAALPARRREVFILAYLHDQSYRQIGEAFGISVATVKNHLAAALSNLRRALRAAWGAPRLFATRPNQALTRLI